MADSEEATSPMSLSRDATPELLTPRSKIKALLATVESSDDEDGTLNAATTRTTTTQKKKKKKKNLGVQTTFNSVLKDAKVMDEDSADEGSDLGLDEPIRPRGKLASRMQGAITTLAQQSIDKEVENDTNSARSGEAGKKPTLERDGGDMEIENDGEDRPVAPGRLQRRAARSPSPGLFVSSPTWPSVSPAKTPVENHDISDKPTNKADRFKALVERKRQERLQREAEEEARRARRQNVLEELDNSVDDEGDDDGDERNGDAFAGTTDRPARPARRAGKKAIEEMNRETQRMARNMQLAHEAKTRKRLTKTSLFERFNYKPSGAPTTSSIQASPRSSAENKKGEKETPPSSPPVEDSQGAGFLQRASRALRESEAGQDVAMLDLDDDGDLPSLKDIQISEPRKLDKGKGKMPPLNPGWTTSHGEPANSVLTQKRRIRIRLPVPNAKLAQVDSDDELQITATAKDRINAVFDSIPLVKSSESQSMQALRALALVRSPGSGKKSRQSKEQVGMTPAELQTYLQQKARQQAKVERDRRLELLKAQGVTVQSAEEREREMQEVEDILAKAREEGERIGQEEKAAAKKEREERGELDPLDWDSSEVDEDYEGGDGDDDDDGDDDEDEGGDGSEMELSGSEDEAGDEAEDGAEDEAGGEAEEMDVADEALDEAQSDVEVELEITQDRPAARRTRQRNQAAILSDDDEEEGGEILIKATQETRTPAKTPMKMASGFPISDPIAPTSAIRSAKKTFIPGLPVERPAGLGLTQIFAGTMDDSLTSQAPGPTPSIMPDFTQPPSPESPAIIKYDTGDEMVLDSQTMVTQPVMEPTTQFGSTIEPTQDGGLQTQTPLLQRFVDLPSTVDTVPNDQQEDATIPESPLVLKGRLWRKADLPPGDRDDTQETVPSSPGSNAFSKMKTAARRRQVAQDEFDRKKSKAKDMVEEQAEESEDEYAGLGGADGEFSDDDDGSGASVNEFLDDAAGNEVDERKMAAFYANQEVENDQKAVEKLFKDITTGRLRKRRAADYDLSDSDDGGEALRRMKRRQFQQMQKSLFADERVKKIAEDPGNQAFLRTIEDRGSDDELMILGDFSGAVVSQSEGTGSRESSVPAEQTKGPLASSGPSSRAPAHMRRTRDGKKPSNLGEIRETVFDLLDERFGSVIPATVENGDSEHDDDHGNGEPAYDARASNTKKYTQSPNPGRRSAHAVVDRMKKQQQQQQNNPGGTSSNGRMAFAAATGSSSFKVPALLRRATTNSSSIISPNTSFSSTTTTGGAAHSKDASTGGGGGFGADAKIKKGAGKKSGVHGFTRDLERNARMKENERRREERKIKGAESRAGLVGGLLGKGSFE